MSTVIRAALNPLLSGPLLWAISHGPLRFRENALAILNRMHVKLTLAGATATLKWLCGLGVLAHVNHWANRWALNHWQLRSDTERWNWSREVAVVTGGCSGIGAVITKFLLAKGIKVAILDVSPLPTAFDQDAREGRLLCLQCDLTDPDAVMKAAKTVQDTLGAPSILINNAGIGASSDMLDSPISRLRMTIELNMVSHWYTCRAFVPDMIRANKGHIVTMASLASFVTIATTADYAASKAGALAFHEGLSASLRNQYKAPLVHTTSIHPGWVRTPMITAMDAAKLQKLGPLLEPEEVARAVVGQILSCRGGQVILPKDQAWRSMLRSFPNWVQEGMRDLASSLEMT